jgi:fructokinase
MSPRIGVDLGGTKIEIVALDDRNQALLRRRVPTPAADYAGIVRVICALIGDAERELGCACPVGIGTPGAVSRESGLMKNANSTVLIGKPFKEDVEHRLGRSILMTNDANCFVLSEATDGAAAGCAVAFGIILGTGVGGGIAVRGRILEGPNTIAGEWGHNPLPWPNRAELPGPECYCGKHGCIETFLCGPALSRQYQQRCGKARTPTQIAEEASMGNEAANAVLALYEDRLARALASVINVLDPDAIVVGGGVSNIAALYDDVPPLLDRYVFSDSVRTKIVKAVHGDSSGVRGAAMLGP